MTVPTELAYKELVWTGAETLFSPGMQADAVGDVRVRFRDALGVVTTLTNGVHVTLSLNATTKIITATPKALPNTAGTLIFDRRTPATQGTNFSNLVNFDPATHTRLHDLAALRDAELRVGLDKVDTLSTAMAAATVNAASAATSAAAAAIARDIAVAAGGGTAVNFSDLAAGLAGVTAPVTFFYFGGRSAKGDGGDGLAVNVAAPAVVTPKYVQDHLGRWFELKRDVYTPQFFGCKGDGITNDTLKMLDLITEAIGNSKPVLLGVGTFPIGATMAFNLPGNAGAPGPDWRGVYGQSIIKAVDGFAGPLIRVRGVPPDGTPVITTFFNGNGFRNFELDGVGGAANFFDLIELTGWRFFDWTGLKLWKASGDGVVTKIASGYDPNPDWSAATNGSIVGCDIQRNKGLGWKDTSLLCAPAMNFFNTYVQINYNGGVRCLSSHCSYVSSSIAYNGYYDLPEVPLINPAAVYGLQIGDPAEAMIENILIDRIEFDRNKTANVVLDQVRLVSRNMCRDVFNDSFTPGTLWPAVGVSIGGIDASIIAGYRDRQTKMRVDNPGSVIGFNVRGGNTGVTDIDIDALHTQVEAGATLAHGNFTTNGLNRARNYRIGQAAGARLVAGRYDAISGTTAFVASAAAGVAFAANEPDTNYDVLIPGNSNNKFWVADADKTIGGFTMRADAAISATVGWRVTRR